MNTSIINAYIDGNWNGEDWLEKLAIVTTTKEGDVKTTHEITPLTSVPTRGYIAVRKFNGDAQIEAGWFSLTLDGKNVVRRKVGGRNTYMFWSEENVIGFVAHKGAK